MRLGNPGIGIAPDRRPVLGKREVEGAIGQRSRLGTAFMSHRLLGESSHPGSAAIACAWLEGRSEGPN
jgi:hypothetical protein